jgi:hypothetical protein
MTQQRSGTSPDLSTEGPQRQLTQRSSPELWGRLVFEATNLPGVIEGHSAVSPASSRALFLSELRDAVNPETSLATPADRLEPVHLHGVDDTSIHLCLPRDRAVELLAAGWAVPHQYGDFGTELLVFGPRDNGELVVVLGFIGESLDFARGNGRDLKEGSALTFAVEDEQVVVSDQRDALNRLQDYVNEFIPEGMDVLQDFLDDRRRAAELENREDE